MDFKNIPFIEHATTKTDVYTNLHGLQSIKNEANRDEALKKVAQQFESLFVNMMMKNMRSANAVFEKDSLFDNDESRFYRDMLDQQRALTLSQGRGIGIADAMYRQLSRNYGSGDVSSENLGAPTSIHGASLNSAPLKRLEKSSIEAKNIESTRVEKPQNIDEKRISISDTPKDFVEKIIPFAKKAAEKLGVDHLVLVAQSALETGWGKYVLSNNQGESSFNLFNIKQGDNWKNETTQKESIEFKDGVVVREKGNFRVYSDIGESFSDYVDFVTNKDRYESAVALADDPKAFVNALHKAGYATDPEYSNKVLSVYERVKSIAEDVIAGDVDGREVKS